MNQQREGRFSNYRHFYRDPLAALAEVTALGISPERALLAFGPSLSVERPVLAVPWSEQERIWQAREQAREAQRVRGVIDRVGSAYTGD